MNHGRVLSWVETEGWLHHARDGVRVHGGVDQKQFNV